MLTEQYCLVMGFVLWRGGDGHRGGLVTAAATEMAACLLAFPFFGFVTALENLWRMKPKRFWIREELQILWLQVILFEYQHKN